LFCCAVSTADTPDDHSHPNPPDDHQSEQENATEKSNITEGRFFVLID
jgi:hypothetical protein